MKERANGLADAVLRWLGDDALSFAGLYALLQPVSAPSVDALFAELEEMEARGLLEILRMDMFGEGDLNVATPEDRRAARLAYRERFDSEVGDTSIDEVGIWVELTSAGETERAQRHGGNRTWALNDFESERRVVIVGRTKEDVDVALAHWRTLRPETTIRRRDERPVTAPAWMPKAQNAIEAVIAYDEFTAPNGEE
jgi:hypothetical protein